MKKYLLFFFLCFGISRLSQAQTYFTFDSIAAPPYICQANVFNVEVFGWYSSMAVTSGGQQYFVRNDTVYVQFYSNSVAGPAMPYPLHRQITIPAPNFGRYHVLVQGFYDGQLHKTISTSLSVCSAIASVNSELPQTPAFQVYPTPTTDFIYLVTERPVSGRLLLTDALGRILLNKEVNETVNQKIDLRPFPKGVYRLQLQKPDGSSTRNVLKL
ncbi:T9SS type A sorting domain-containing protein [Adhaeribacter soli]|uniref:T9SS type A sorting domain-containing protein n=1 Tax=Adhaeribacter soli TaxID=2607655 RepID=A0A5N1J2X9_9BACT|nr:T9SS type A sorting domain-containing protein [Adhaeribacter soli]KAA9340939.1 T9SS type A sorting domain-containing protein [Adhaeribacter soli]